MRDNIILIGMPGSGKSTVGVVLAKLLGMRFVDSDLVIQEEREMLLHEIIEREGIDGFLEVENDVNAALCVGRSVVATGGSAVYGRKAMEHFDRIGTIVYLRLSCDSIAARLGDLAGRGVVIRPGQSLEELYRERVPLYERYAGITVDCEGKEISRIAKEIAERLTPRGTVEEENCAARPT